MIEKPETSDDGDKAASFESIASMPPPRTVKKRRKLGSWIPEKLLG